jgi:hypothetical protein
MKKLNNREKAVIIAALLAALYMGATFLFSPFGGSLSTPESEDTNQGFVLEIAQSLAQNKLTKTEQTILEKAQNPWPAQPFILFEPTSAETETTAAAGASEAAPGSIRFTGCLEIGTKRLAIINGKEYETQDRIEGSPYIIRSISFEQVLLQAEDDRTIVVPMENAMAEEAAPKTQQDK